MLRSRIHSGQLGPGDRLPNERDLATSLGIGRITLRAALRLLADEGYLVSKRGNLGGTFVSDLAEPLRAWIERVRRAPEWMTDLIEYRKAIEMRAAELAAKHRNRKQIAEMKAAIDQASGTQTRQVFRQADHRFHVAMADASGSARLLEAIVQARGEMFMPVDRLPFNDHFAQTCDEHTRILDAIVARDPATARAAAERHLQGSLEDFVDLILHSKEAR